MAHSRDNRIWIQVWLTQKQSWFENIMSSRLEAGNNEKIQVQMYKALK